MMKKDDSREVILKKLVGISIFDSVIKVLCPHRYWMRDDAHGTE